MSLTAALNDQVPLSARGMIVPASDIVRDSSLGLVSPGGAHVESVFGQVNVVRENGLIEQIGYADVIRRGDFLVVVGGTIAVMCADGSRLRIVDNGQGPGGVEHGAVHGVAIESRTLGTVW